MKNLLFIFPALLFLASFHSSQQTFCSGFKIGYKNGWCYNQISPCTTPNTPNCPLPEIYKEDYQDGYNRGFIKGIKDFEGR